MKTFFECVKEINRDILLQDLFEIRDENTTGGDVAFHELDEASLSRLWQHVQNRSFAILTAYRNKNTKEQNVQLNRSLRGELNSRELGPHSLIGHWRECSVTDKNGDPIKYSACPPDKLVDVVERSYFVVKPSNMTDEQFRKIIFTLGGKYKQDGVVLKIENDFGVFSPRNGQKIVPLNKGAALNQVAQAYSQHVKKQNVPFIFEGIEKPDGLSYVKEAARKQGFHW